MPYDLSYKAHAYITLSALLHHNRSRSIKFVKRQWEKLIKNAGTQTFWWSFSLIEPIVS